MNHIYIKEQKNLVGFFLLLYLVAATLASCTRLPNESLPTQNTLDTPVPTVYEPPTLETDPFPFRLAEVYCEFESNTIANYDHWADQLIPGVSTIDDLLAVKNIPSYIQPERMGIWRYSSGSASFDFNDGVLYQKKDPRTKLGEIIQHYGLPQKVVWEIPLTRYDEASYATYLVYPEQKAFFYDWDKVTRFAPNTEFVTSIFYTQDDFDGALSGLTYADYNRYVESAWPCGE